MMQITKLLVLVLSLVVATAVQAASVNFLVRTGTDAEGNPMFRLADSRDTHLAGLFELTQGSRAINEVARYYEAIQKDKLQASLQARGMSAQQIQQYLAVYQAEPVFIEASNSSSGSFNDWKGKFSVQSSNGQTYSYTTPRVVFAMGSDMVRSGNRALIEQTLVHEIGHGGMCQCHGKNALPDSPWLSRPHSGGSVTDEPLAFIEGWAEFVGAYFTGRTTIAEDPARSIESNWYAKRSDGNFKSASELTRTEGWNATVLYWIATQARDQNAMWKMTQVMSRTRPQSTMQMLASLVQYFPELAPTVNRVLYQASGGQISSPSGINPTQYAGSVNGTGSSYNAGAYANNGQYYGQNNGQYTATRYANAYYGNNYAQYYAAYNQYRNYYASYGRGYSAYAPTTTAGAGSGAPTGTAAAAATGVADPGPAIRLDEETSRLTGLYNQRRQELNAVPWWKFWEKSKIEKDMALMEDALSRMRTVQLASADPVAPPTGNAPTAAGGSGPVAPSNTYNSMIEAVRNSDTARARDLMQQHQQLYQRRRAAQQTGPTGER